MELKEKQEQLMKQFQEVDQQANELITLRTKLAGAIEFTQALLQDEEGEGEAPVVEEKAKAKK